MRTTVELDDALVEQARRVLGGPSLKAIIEDGLREAVRRRLRERLLDAMGTIDFAFTEEELKQFRHDKQW